LYLRRVPYDDGYHYVIRESFLRQGCWQHRNLMDLGKDPESYIEYTGGNGFYFDDAVEEALNGKGVEYSTEELEGLFLPFLDPEIRRIIENFNHGASGTSRWKHLSHEEMVERQGALHSLDKRRLHYLRCGRINIGSLEGRPWKFLNVLLEKSRDEIEHVIERMERELKPQEVRPYLYTAFHLQSWFPHHPMRHRPAALDPERVDECFLEELCRLNRDPLFFRGVSNHRRDSLHPYLRKYAILYFDSQFAWRPFAAEDLRDRMWWRQFRQPVSGQPALQTDEACRRLGISREEYGNMNHEELIRCYRRRAKALHPDGGGDHDSFVALTEAYECLMLKKK